ncbi:MAG TPA: hypothetical protein VFO68_21785 [Actinophytocola sp.]|nr:hypothetical protein [Actinophytocola sp.]HET9142015.1 hypothetical protein [Actinophytocola sp.]
MAVGKRVAGVLPLAGAMAAAMALAGVAVFTVTSAGCADSGHYVQRDGAVELVGGCLDPADLPSAPVEQEHGQAPARPASNELVNP